MHTLSICPRFERPTNDLSRFSKLVRIDRRWTSRPKLGYTSIGLLTCAATSIAGFEVDRFVICDLLPCFVTSPVVHRSHSAWKPRSAPSFSTIFFFVRYHILCFHDHNNAFNSSYGRFARICVVQLRIGSGLFNDMPELWHRLHRSRRALLSERSFDRPFYRLGGIHWVPK